jgi:TetR/AcrR family transcriptional regulator of autoinduction and epiphytic fitness
MAHVKAPASGGRRQQRSRETRRRIVASAHTLFVVQGYASTTIQQIAERGDVAWQTVYSVFGTKAAILSAVFDIAVAGDDEPVAVLHRPFVQAIAEAPRAADKTRILARHLRGTAERTASVISVIESAATTDPEIAQLWTTLQDQRSRGMGIAAASFAEQGMLRSELDARHAADILWFYTGPWAYRAFVTDRGWTLDEYEGWLAETLRTQLMRDEA